ncbi:MAG: hypothetical protein MZV64_23915 [Ignavibacteriales bacterium]|nr:hypothetical protein [Ignavibacteriales bacterium]
MVCHERPGHRPARPSALGESHLHRHRHGQGWQRLHAVGRHSTSQPRSIA